MRPALALLLASLVLAAPAPAATWGIGDNKARSLEEPMLADLGLRKARLITPWDAVWTRPRILDDWLETARARGYTPLVAFNHSTNDICPPPCAAPSRGTYRRMIREFRRRYPWVRELSPWNEANHGKQPTARRPELAARYYEIVREECRGCTIVAADVLDSSNMLGWMRRFLRSARPRPRLVGLHNYRDVARGEVRRTDALMRMTRARLWLTETGGVVSLRAGHALQFGQERRAAEAIHHLFDMVRDRPRIDRVYLYQWQRTNRFDLFDAGLVRPDGSPRPAYFAARERLQYLTDSR